MRLKRTAIWWIRRDLRLADNQALASALRDGSQVIPLFIEDPRLWASPFVGKKRLTFLLESLSHLDTALKKVGSYLVYRRGDPHEILTALLNETGATSILAEEDYTPFARKRDHHVAESLPLELTPGLTLIHPSQLMNKTGQPYTVFTPFSKTWMSQSMPAPADVLSKPLHIPTPQGLNTQQIPQQKGNSPNMTFPPGEAQALCRLLAFIDHDQPPIYRYAETRNRPDLNSTSGLSPYLRFGMLSARQVVVAALAAIDTAPDQTSRRSAEVWLNELIWREFYQSILYHFPHVRQTSFLPEYRSMSWADDREGLEAWQQGQTGYPLIDAVMRQLKQSGWIHNRNRMVVASFLAKNLLIDWREGERWFMQQLIDGDPAANNGGWQWTAGVGTDAAPYFRIFNPIKQSQKFDPDGTYIRSWVPELSTVPNEYIHEPWKMPQPLQLETKCRIGVDYPEPILVIAFSRQRVLNAFQLAKSAPNKQLTSSKSGLIPENL
jgi:deoxyribodipyrimidine photo-lyase